MANFKTFDDERYADLIKAQRGKANTLGPDSDDITEGFGKNKTTVSDKVWLNTPDASSGLKWPAYGDYPNTGNTGTRYVQYRLHSFLPSGTSGPSSCQTFFTISADPDSHRSEDINAVRMKHLISPSFSPNKSDAAHEDLNFRGFQLALYPAQSDGGIGNDLIADTSNGPIPPTADPSAQYGLGDEYWYVDYDEGIVRLSVAPTTGKGYSFNPNSVYGDINGTEVADDAYGAITLFATFYQHDGSVVSDLFASQFVTIGDGVITNGTYTGAHASTFQSAVDYLGTNGGGTVFVKDGYYTFDDGYVDVSDNIEIRGLNNVFIRGAEHQHIFNIMGSNCRIHNLSLEMASEVINPCSAIQISGSQDNETVQNVLIDRCRILIDGDAYGVSFFPKYGGLTFQNIEINNNIFEDDNTAGLSNLNDPAFIGLITPPIADDGRTFRATFKNIEIKENVFKCTQTDAISMVSEWGTVDGLYIDGNKEISGGDARINIRFNANSNIRLSNNIMPSSNVAVYDGSLAENRFTSTSLSAPNESENNRFYGFEGIRAYGKGGLYVAVGTSGEIQTSPDGITWTAQTADSGFSDTFYDVAYDGKGLWVVVGENAEIQTSPDGINWTHRTPANSYSGNFLGVNYGGGLWIAVGTSGEIQTSPDGITWTHRTPDDIAGNINGVAHNGKDLWVLLGDGGKVNSSPDGINWTQRDAGAAGALNDVYYQNGLWIAVGANYSNVGIRTSSDGITWTYSTAAAGFDGVLDTFYSITHNGKDLWCATGKASQIQTSPDGITWTSQSSAASDNLRGNVYNGKDLWIIVGDGGEIMSSPDSVTWTQRNAAGSYSGDFYSVACIYDTNTGLVATGSDYNGAGVVAIGSGNQGIGVSAFGDGYGAGVKSVGGYLGGPGVLAFGNGADGYDNGSGGEFYAGGSASGVVAKGGLGAGAGIKSYGRGQLAVVVGNDGFIASSSNCIDWTWRASGTKEHLWAVAHNGRDLWVAVGANGTILTSSDTINWTSRTAAGGYTDVFYGIAHNKQDMWVVVGKNAEIQTSVDGINWVAQSIGITEANDIEEIIYSEKENIWALMGSGGSDAIWTSRDGAVWEHRQSAFVDFVECLGYDGKDLWAFHSLGGDIYITSSNFDDPSSVYTPAHDLYVMAHNGKDLWLAAGAHGFIVTSPNGTDWTPQTAAGGFSGAFYGAAYNKKDTWVVVGQSGKIQTSSDGVLWTNRDSKTTSILNGVAFQEGSNAGLVAQGSDYNGTGIIAIGKGNHAYGIEAFGDGYGAGVKSVGGYLGGPGVLAFGNGADGYDNGSGGEFYAGGSASGVVAKGGLGAGAGIKSYGRGQLAVVVGNDGFIASSSNCIDWTWRASGTKEFLYAVAHNGRDLWVAVGANGTILTSSDTINWTSRTAAGGYTDRFYGIAHNKQDMWVVVGENAEIQTSVDGINWVAQSSDITGANDIVEIIYSEKENIWALMVGHGSEAIWTSRDGAVWERRQYSGGHFVECFGYDGKDLWAFQVGIGASIYITSSNFDEPLPVYAPAQDLYVMAHNGKDLWLAAGENGFIVTSPNGTDWTPQIAAGGFSGIFYGAAYNKKDTWVVVGESGKIQTSSDGVHWTNRDSKTTSTLNGVAFQEGSNAGLVAQGSDYNGTGIIAIGKGNHAYGIEAFGDAYGPGVKSVGGDWGGAGIIAFGGGTGRRSGQNEPNTVCVRTAIGIIAYGAGSSNGVDGYSGPVGDGYGVVGRAMADGNGVVGIAYGKGAGVTGASNRGYGVVAQNTSMPVVRASMHIDPQITLPALADIGDICCVYSVAGVGELYFYDGSAWIKLS